MRSILRTLSFCILLYCVSMQEVFAQDDEIKIGQKCPDLIIKNLINYKDPSLKLSDLKGKLILIDFWNTWCSSCISSMERLQPIQKELMDQLFILPVTEQKRDVIQKFWKNNHILRKLSFPSVVEDTILHKYFPHKTVPYMVWLDENLIVKAITTSQYANKENILTILNKRNFDFIIPKAQIIFDYHKSLIDSSLFNDNKVRPNFYSILTSSDDKWKGGSYFERDSTLGTVKLTAINHYVISLYSLAFQSKIKWAISPRLVLDVKDKSRYHYDKRKEYADRWKKLNTYSYQQVVPLKVTDSIFFSTMVANLNQYLGLRARIEKRLTKCYVIIDHLKEKKTNEVKYDDKQLTVDSLVDLLNHESSWLPVVNEVRKQRSQRLLIDLSKEIRPEIIKKILLMNSLDMVIEEREVDMLVVEEI